MEDLRALASIVSESVRVIEQSCTSRSISLPSLNTPFDPQNEGAAADPAYLKASADIIAAAGQLTALLRPPPVHLMTTAIQFHVSSAMRYVMETNVVEILREAGPKGAPIEKIAEQAKTNANKLCRALRLLATNHIFQEVAPDVFANNRLSLILDSGKNVSDLDGANPTKKYINSNCAGALLTHCTDHIFKASSHLTDTLINPATRDSFAVQDSAFNTAYGTPLPFWAWLEQPGNERDLQLFGLAMEGMTNFFVRDSTGGFDFGAVEKGGIVVDVGGGVGSSTLMLAKKNSHLKFVVQDREPVIAQAQGFWKEQFPEAISSGAVTLQASDFFAGQPISKPAVFFLRFILHDWSEADCKRILSTLRAAAGPQTQLVIVDMIVAHACAESPTGKAIEGSDPGAPPAPLLPNGGMSSLIAYELDFQMMAALNGQERTLDQLDRLLTESGWKLAKVFRTPYYAGGHEQALAVPA